MKKYKILFLYCFISMLACSESNEMEEVFLCDQSISYSVDIIPIMDTYCAYSGCHFGQFAWGNFKKYEEIKSRVGFITTKVIDIKSMPPENASGPLELTVTELEKLECWIQNGALNN